MAGVTNQTLSGLGGEATSTKHKPSPTAKRTIRVGRAVTEVRNELIESDMVTGARVATLENVISSANINQETTATASGVDTISLPKTAANTGMQVQMFGQSAENLVVNGDFRNGLTGMDNRRRRSK